MKLSLSTLAAAISAGFVTTVAGLQFYATGTINDGPFPEDLNGSTWNYTYPVRTFEFVSQGQQLQMAFMDVPPCCTPNGKTIYLEHGKNFCAETWAYQIEYFTNQGYRVIAGDKIGWGKSSKPSSYQFSLSQLAFNTHGLLMALGIDKYYLLGHSYGGTVSLHIAMQYPDAVLGMMILDAISLEDYTGKGVPYISVDDQIAQERTSTFESIQAYETKYYYAGNWKDDYAPFVNMLVNVYQGSQRDGFTTCQGKIVDCVLTQNIVYYFDKIIAPVLLMVGDLDTSFIGQWADPSITSQLGNFKVLGQEACSQIKDCTLHVFSGQGHATQISEPDLFNEFVHDWLLSLE